MDQMDWELLNLISVEGSASKVAPMLFISQPAVTYRLNRMEAEYGKQLFVRSSKGVTLTEAGQTLLSYADKLLYYHGLVSNSMRAETPYEEIVTVGSCYVLTPFIADLMKKFHELHPSVRFNFVNDSSKNLVKKYLEGELHIAFIRGIFGDIRNKHTFFQEPLRLISKKTVTFGDLTDLPFIDYNMAAIQRYWINLWSNTKLSAPIAKISDAGNLEACYHMVRSGMGWSAVTSLLLLIKDFREMNTYLLTDTAGETLHVGTQVLFSDSPQTPQVYSTFIDFVISDQWHSDIANRLAQLNDNAIS